MSEEVNARILYWGIEGAGKETNLKVIHGKLRPDHRGEVEAHPSRIDPSTAYHELPIELGNLGGVHTRLRLIAPPPGPEQAPTRRQLLDRVDGIVFVADTRRDKLDENLASLNELRELLGEYGRNLDEVPLVFQYNKRDLSDPFALEELHRKLDLRGAAAFEAVATEGTGVLEALTTISKRVVRHLREQGPLESEPAELEAVAEESAPLVDPLPTEGLAPELLAPESADVDPGSEIEEMAALTEAAFEDSFRDATETLEVSGDSPLPALGGTARGTLEIAQVGSARAVGARAVAVPLVLRDETGTERSLTLTVSLDALDGAED